MRLNLLLTTLFSALCFSLSAQTVETINSGSGNWTVPCGVTSIQVECWGGGGSGAGESTNNGASNARGGGGGGYVVNTLVVTPGANLAYSVGAGGIGGTGAGQAGGNTTFSTLQADGGGAGGNFGPSGGAGGGGSGGAVTTGANGGTPSGTTGGPGGAGGNGGAGGAGGTDGNDGTAGTAPGGGGGGGGDRDGGAEDGGNGGSGRIVITYTPSTTSGCDPCTAIPISSFPYTYSGTTVGGSNSVTGGCEGNWIGTLGNAEDVIFTMTVGADSHYSIQLTGTDPANVMDVAVISAGSCSGPFTCLPNGSWEGGLQTTGTTLGSGVPGADSPCRTVWFETAGTYYLFVDSDAGDEGVFTLNVDEIDVSTLYGDECTTAAGLSGSSPVTINADNCSYTTSSTDPTSADTPPSSTLFCAGSIENTVWIEFQSDGSGTPVNVDVTGVTCSPGYMTFAGPPINGYTYYGSSAQFGIFTSSTDACGGTYASADPCQSISSGATYTTSLPNGVVETYFFVIDGNGGAECDFTIEVTNVIPLPVQLSDFTVTKQELANILDWATVSEINAEKFIIERSYDGEYFEEIGEVAAQGNSSSEMYYSFKDDKGIFNEVVYYRLVQQDFNGEAITLETKVVYRNFESERVLRVTNMLGQDVDENHKGFVIYFFEDGTSIKKYRQ